MTIRKNDRGRQLTSQEAARILQEASTGLRQPVHARDNGRPDDWPAPEVHIAPTRVMTSRMPAHISARQPDGTWTIIEGFLHLDAGCPVWSGLDEVERARILAAPREEWPVPTGRVD